MVDITFLIPCYNSQEYMEKCIDSLLVNKEGIEIIIIDDGSSDNTGKIADKYHKKFPDIVKVVHQENGGHGEGINQGIKLSRGKYFKVIDSDDWVDEDAYDNLMKKIKHIDSDLIVMNYVYNYNDGRKRDVINYRNVFKNDEEIVWDKTGSFRVNQYLFIHSMIFKTSVLKECKINLPKHVCYEDNLFIYIPLPKIKTIYYIDKDFYQYFIGRSDQTMQESQMIKKSKDQVFVAIELCNYYKLNEIKSKKLRKIMKRECIMMAAAAVTFSRLKRNEEGEREYKEFWLNIKENNYDLYKSIRKSLIAGFVSIPSPLGRKIALFGYRLANKVVGFN